MTASGFEVRALGKNALTIEFTDGALDNIHDQTIRDPGT